MQSVDELAKLDVGPLVGELDTSAANSASRITSKGSVIVTAIIAFIVVTILAVASEGLVAR